MNIFTNKDIKKLFIRLSCAIALFIVLTQLSFCITYGSLNIILLLLSLLLTAVVFGGCYLYFYKQQQIIDNAISQIRLFVSGDADARIESGSEGSLYKLFHEVNTLATTLNAHAVREQNTKVFSKIPYRIFPTSLKRLLQRLQYTILFCRMNVMIRRLYGSLP